MRRRGKHANHFYLGLAPSIGACLDQRHLFVRTAHLLCRRSATTKPPIPSPITPAIPLPIRTQLVISTELELDNMRSFDIVDASFCCSGCEGKEILEVSLRLSGTSTA